MSFVTRTCDGIVWDRGRAALAPGPKRNLVVLKALDPLRCRVAASLQDKLIGSRTAIHFSWQPKYFSEIDFPWVAI